MVNPSILKEKLHQHCLHQIFQQVQTIQSALTSIREARNNETKSSVGDKYETGRAMMQMEEEKYQRQLANVLHSKMVLESIDPAIEKKKVELGSLVVTETGKYYLSVSLGKIKLEDGLFFAISIQSPVGQALLHKRKGETFHFNNKHIYIFDVS